MKNRYLILHRKSWMIGKAQDYSMAREKEYLFRFKQFDVRHGESSMHVGVDAVLLGAWAAHGLHPQRILDVGTGCGVIALMMAQRFEGSLVDAIDIDNASVEEACLNFRESRWHDRMSVCRMSFNELLMDFRESVNSFDTITDSFTLSSSELRRINGYDLIVSNPPYFDSGVVDLSSSRLIARHQDSLSPSVLVKSCRYILKDEGLLAIVIPAEMQKETVDDAISDGNLKLVRMLSVRGNPYVNPKRVLLEFQLNINDMSESGTGKSDIGMGGIVSEEGKQPNTCENEELIIESSINCHTDDYKNLTRDFYLKF